MDDNVIYTASFIIIAAISVVFVRNKPVPQHDSILTGSKLYAELMNTNSEARFRTDARMDKPTFLKLLKVLMLEGGLADGLHVLAGEKLFFLLFTLTGFSTRQTAARWQHSNSTVDVCVHEVVHSLLSLSDRFFVPPDTDDNDPFTDRRFQPFKFAAGALDGSHMPAVVSSNDCSTYRNRKQQITQNVLACCNFDMTFNFCLCGWEGSAHDGQVLSDAVENHNFRAPIGRYFLADAGYALSRLCLTPYRGVRYHLKEWRKGNKRPQNKEELYNLRHSSLRNVVERIFGVAKKRFPILVHMNSFDVTFQSDLIMCTFMIHNFIRKEQGFEDEWYVWTDDDGEDGPIAVAPVEVAGNPAHVAALNAWRDGIASELWADYQLVLAQRNIM